MLYGKDVENGAMPLSKTLRELEFTDVGGLLPRELDATIEHLITACSGVYHLAFNWAGQPVISREWARRISSLVPPLNEMSQLTHLQPSRPAPPSTECKERHATQHF